MIMHSFKLVRAAVGYRGCNEVDEVDRPQPRWSGLRPLLYLTCVDAVLSGHPIAAQLSAVIGQSNLTGQQKNSMQGSLSVKRRTLL
jgi:hypothetical protein